MAVVPSGIIKQREIDAAIRRAERALKPDVIRIRYALTLDSAGDEAIFFRVLLTDKASREDRLYQTTEHIRESVIDLVQPMELFGMHAYFNFRSASEQAQLREAAWE
jgi:hypothetical protein